LEANLSTLSAADTVSVVDFATTALLGSRYSRDDGSVNIKAAAKELGDALARRRAEYAPSSLEANRKLLERALAGNIGRLRAGQAERLLMLVGCLDQSTGEEAGRVWHYMTTLREWHPDWFEPASDSETVALRLRSWDVEIVRAKYIARYSRPLIPPRAVFKSRIATGKRLLGAEVPVEEFSGGKRGGRRTEPPTGPIVATLLDALDAFEEVSLDAGHHPDRVKHAIRRFLGPFCAWARSNGQCTGWHQLTNSDRRNSFKAGIAAERVWLGKPPRLKHRPILPPEFIAPQVTDPAIAAFRAETERRAAKRKHEA
jgi:hypothetical protein